MPFVKRLRGCFARHIIRHFWHSVNDCCHEFNSQQRQILRLYQLTQLSKVRLYRFKVPVGNSFPVVRQRAHSCSCQLQNILYCPLCKGCLQNLRQRLIHNLKAQQCIQGVPHKVLPAVNMNHAFVPIDILQHMLSPVRQKR